MNDCQLPPFGSISLLRSGCENEPPERSFLSECPLASLATLLLFGSTYCFCWLCLWVPRVLLVFWKLLCLLKEV